MNKDTATKAGATVGVLGAVAYVTYLMLSQPAPPPPPAIPITFAEFPGVTAEETNLWAQNHFYPVTKTNIFTNTFNGTVTTNILTNSFGGYHASIKMNVEWESVPGQVYAVEWSPNMSDPTPMLCTNWTNISLVSTCGWIGQGWHPIMHPIQATGTVARWSGPIWGNVADVRMFRIKALPLN